MTKTKKMLSEFFHFRKIKNLKKAQKFHIREDFHEKYHIKGYYNTTKEGYPITIERIGKTKVNEIFNEFPFENCLEYKIIAEYERCINIVFPLCSEQIGKRVDKTVNIIDLKGVKITKIFNKKFKKFLKNMSTISQNYYPEILHKMYIVNAPFLFKGIWNIVKHMLDK